MRIELCLGDGKGWRMEERMGQIGVVVRMMRRSERCSGRSGRRGGHLQLVTRGVIDRGQLQVRIQITDRSSANEGILRSYNNRTITHKPYIYLLIYFVFKYVKTM